MMAIGSSELEGEVSLRADLILECASRIWVETVSTGWLVGEMHAEAMRLCVADAMALAAEVDRSVARLRRARKGEAN